MSGRCQAISGQSTPSTYCMTRPSSIRSQQIFHGVCNPVGLSSNGSDGGTYTIIAVRCGGCSSAVSHWL